MKQKPIAPHSLIFQLIDRKLVWLEVEHKDDLTSILNAGIEPFDTEEAEDQVDDQSRFKKVLEKIRPQFKLGLFTKYEVIFIIPSHRITARYLETPPTDDESLVELLEFEVSEALQIDIEDISFDTIISSQHSEGEIKHLLWVATRKNFINTLLEEWPRDTFIPNEITTDINAVYEYLLHAAPDQIVKPSLLILREGERVIITIVDTRAIYYFRSVSINKNHNQDQMKQLSLEISRTITYTTERLTQEKIQNLIFVGFDNWPLEHFNDQAMTHSLSVTRLSLDVLQSAFSIDGGTIESEHVSLLSIAYQRHQLHQRGVNLLKEKPRESNWKAWVPETAIPLKQFGTYAGIMIGAFVILWIGQIIWLNYAAADRSQTGQSLLKLADQLKQEEIALQTYVRTDVHYGDVLFILSELLPDEMLVKTISLDDQNGIEIALTGGDQQRVVEIIDEMNQNKHFRNVILDRAANENDGFTLYLTGTLIPG